jgi:hypothetical protein
MPCRGHNTALPNRASGSDTTSVTDIDTTSSRRSGLISARRTDPSIVTVAISACIFVCFLQVAWESRLTEIASILLHEEQLRTRNHHLESGLGSTSAVRGPSGHCVIRCSYGMEERISQLLNLFTKGPLAVDEPAIRGDIHPRHPGHGNELGLYA